MLMNIEQTLGLGFHGLQTVRVAMDDSEMLRLVMFNIFVESLSRNPLLVAVLPLCRFRLRFATSEI
jgi:hypothetical protein